MYNSFCTAQRAKASRGLCGNAGSVGHMAYWCLSKLQETHGGSCAFVTFPLISSLLCYSRTAAGSADEKLTSDKRLPPAAQQKPACANSHLLGLESIMLEASRLSSPLHAVLSPDKTDLLLAVLGAEMELW